MLAAYYSRRFGASAPESEHVSDLLVRQPANNFRLTEQLAHEHIKRARIWTARSRTRTTCDDAYSDLLLATLEYAGARGQAEATPDLHRRLILLGEIQHLMTELLEWSHELRVRCRVPFITAPSPSPPMITGWR
jgi:hypothetical protein